METTQTPTGQRWVKVRQGIRAEEPTRQLQEWRAEACVDRSKRPGRAKLNHSLKGPCGSTYVSFLEGSHSFSENTKQGLPRTVGGGAGAIIPWVEFQFGKTRRFWRLGQEDREFQVSWGYVAICHFRKPANHTEVRKGWMVVTRL